MSENKLFVIGSEFYISGARTSVIRPMGKLNPR